VPLSEFYRDGRDGVATVLGGRILTSSSLSLECKVANPSGCDEKRVAAVEKQIEQAMYGAGNKKVTRASKKSYDDGRIGRG